MTRTTAWVHPSPNISRAQYDPIPDDNANSSVPIYEALSYAWGPPQKIEAAEVMASETNSHQTRTLPITRNLANALRHLRFCDRPRTMWVDAVCIDQNNPQEQSEQVQRMGQIYLLASRVVAWLGPSLPDSSLALKTLTKIGEQGEYLTGSQIIPSPGCSHPDWHTTGTPLPFTMDELTAIINICKAEYMRRLWVVQELQLANAKSVIVCGDEEMLWIYFRRAILFIASKEGIIPQALSDAITAANQVCQSVRNVPLASLIYRYHDRRCADVRDKLYGLVYLIDQAARKYVLVNYSKPALDVFKQVFLASLEQEKRLAQLPFANPDVLSTPGWPTWLPNWSRLVRTTTDDFSGFPCSSISAAHAKYIAPDRLEVTGVPFATVSAVAKVLNLNDGLIDIVEMLREMGLENLKSSVYPTGESCLDAYLQTFATDEITKLVTQPETEEQLPQVAKLLSQIKSLYKSCVFTMPNGYVGMLSGQPQQKDEVFIILGCAAPMILRPTSSGEYGVVGDCYVHGIMNGEVLVGAVPHPWKVGVYANRRGHWLSEFRNTDTGTLTKDDPRLADILMPAEWESIEFEWTAADPVNCRKFRNRYTGEVINSDPRLFPEALLERGIPLRTITLI
ncbi:HET-domain-containing protein [Nemania abortiva]|nr:HET-domain-containing protein [Nemania abortiva]